MKRNSMRRRICLAAVACVAAAQAVSAVPAGATVAGHAIQLRYCWSLTTFRPTCPLATLNLYANGTVANMPGSSWTETPTTLTISFVNPTPNVQYTSYTGTMTTSTPLPCYAGTMVANRLLSPPTMTGVWQGCIQ